MRAHETRCATKSAPGAAQRAFRVSHFPGVGPFSVLFFLYLYAPIAILILFSFNAGRSATIWNGFGISWYGKVFGNEDIRHAAINSLLVAGTATAIATTVAVLAAIALIRGSSSRAKGPMFAIVSLPLMIPEIVTAVATMAFFSTVGISLGIGNLMIAHTVFCIPFAFLPIRARLKNMDPSLESAARDLYANEWYAFREVTLPLLWPGIISGAMLAFIVSIDDVIISLMVAPAGATTLPVYIFGMVRMGITPEVNAVCSLLFLLSLVVVTLSWLAGRRGVQGKADTA